MVDGSQGRWKFQRTGGGRRQGAKRPERASPGPLAPASLFCLAGRGAALGPPLGRQTPPPPGGTPALPPTPNRQGKSPALRLIQPHPVHRWGKLIFMQIALCFPANSRIVEDRKICFVCKPICFPPIKEARPMENYEKRTRIFSPGRVFRPYGRHCPWPCSMWWP